LYAIDPKTPIKDYENFVTKFWNAARFIIQQTQNTKSTKIFSELTEHLQKKEKKLNEFETRIIYKTTELQKDYEDMLNKNTLDEIQNKIIDFIKNDFCDKYLEIQKHQSSENNEKVMLWCLGKILKMLHPFVPFITQHIWNIT
jgi:valyl-tRNA synthetase